MLAYVMIDAKCVGLEKDLLEMRERLENKEKIIEELITMRNEVRGIVIVFDALVLGNVFNIPFAERVAKMRPRRQRANLK